MNGFGAQNASDSSWSVTGINMGIRMEPLLGINVEILLAIRNQHWIVDKHKKKKKFCKYFYPTQLT